MKPAYTFRASVWIYPGPAAWYFVTVPKKTSVDIKKAFGWVKRGWGSLPVGVIAHDIEWKTSIFYDAKRQAYLLPLKAAIRKKARILPDMQLRVTLRILV